MRTGGLPQRTNRLLLITGLVTFPGIVAAEILASFVPTYLADELSFAVIGVAWVLWSALAVGIRPEKDVAEPTAVQASWGTGRLGPLHSFRVHTAS